jgi:hypothetical protein
MFPFPVHGKTAYKLWRLRGVRVLGVYFMSLEALPQAQRSRVVLPLQAGKHPAYRMIIDLGATEENLQALQHTKLSRPQKTLNDEDVILNWWSMIEKCRGDHIREKRSQPW